MNVEGILAHSLTIAAFNSRMFLGCLYAATDHIFVVLNVPRENQGLLGLENVAATSNHYACSLPFQEAAFANNLSKFITVKYYETEGLSQIFHTVNLLFLYSKTAYLIQQTNQPKK